MIFSTASSAPVSVLFSEPKIPQSLTAPRHLSQHRPFQCSSASRKFLNLTAPRHLSQHRPFQCSSASRKFLNESAGRRPQPQKPKFQCSSASRKFLNALSVLLLSAPSALFQCSSASRKFLNWREAATIHAAIYVSVLFSEPKIPQSERLLIALVSKARFSALQRAENSSIRRAVHRPRAA